MLLVGWGSSNALVSISMMWALILAKERVGHALHNEAILADAACARVCIGMSVVLFVSSGVYVLTGFAYADAIERPGTLLAQRPRKPGSLAKSQQTGIVKLWLRARAMTWGDPDCFDSPKDKRQKAAHCVLLLFGPPFQGGQRRA